MNIEGCEYITDLSKEDVICWIIRDDELITDTDEMWAILTGKKNVPKDGDTKTDQR